MSASPDINYQDLSKKIKLWAEELGFSSVGITDVNLADKEADFLAWLEKGYHGTMSYMENHGLMRARPQELLPGTLRAISVSLNYLPIDAKFAKTLSNPQQAYISRYALGRDYHKLMRNKLKKLGDNIKLHCQNLNFRPFVDSAPVMERQLAEKAGLGWTGKHSLIIKQDAGSWFFLGELLVNIPLPVDQPVEEKCGHCVVCLKICPTQAIVEPYVVDARRCISYLTIEHDGEIDEALRPLMGNRIYGCDDCQLICPWNKYGQLSDESDFYARNNFNDIELLALFSWTEDEFLLKTQGSPIRRIGYRNWLRNISIALGNADPSEEITTELEEKLGLIDDVLDSHIRWALAQQKKNLETNKRLTQRLIRTVEKGMPRDAH